MTLALLASSSMSHLLVLIEDFSNAVLSAIKKLIGLLIRNMWHGFEDSVLWNLISKIAELQVLEYSFLRKKKEKKDLGTHACSLLSGSRRITVFTVCPFKANLEYTVCCYS